MWYSWTGRLSAIEDMKVGHAHPWPWLIKVQGYTKMNTTWVLEHADIPGIKATDVLRNWGRHAPQEITSLPFYYATRWIGHTSRYAWNTAWYYNRETFLRRI